MDFEAIGKKVFSLHLKYAASLLAMFDTVVVYTTQKVTGQVTVTNVIAEGVPPVLRSIQDHSDDLGKTVLFFASGSLEGIEPQLIYEDILKIPEYRDKVKIVGNTVYLS